MKASVYELEVYGSVLESVHGHSTTITEIFIKDLNLAVNLGHGDSVNCFEPTEERYQKAKLIKQLIIDNEFGSTVKLFYEQKKHIYEMAKEIVR